MEMVKRSFDFRIVLAFLLLALVFASPFIYRAWLIKEIYVYPDVREHVLDSVFFLRETLGLTIGDLTIKDVILDGRTIHIVVHEKYHGLIAETDYDDLEQDYFIDYSYDSDGLELVNVEK